MMPKPPLKMFVWPDVRWLDDGSPNLVCCLATTKEEAMRLAVDSYLQPSKRPFAGDDAEEEKDFLQALEEEECNIYTEPCAFYLLNGQL